MPVATELFSPSGNGGRKRDRLLFVGRLNAQKGIEMLLRALAVTTTKASLDVVGDGPDGERLKALAGELEIANRVRWVGALPQQQLTEYYRSATALVVPSVNEGLGLVAVEAQLCETAVIAFDSGGCPTSCRTDGQASWSRTSRRARWPAQSTPSFPAPTTKPPLAQRGDSTPSPRLPRNPSLDATQHSTGRSPGRS